MNSSSFQTQPYAGIATFGRRPFSRDLSGVDVAVVGIPYDGSTSYRSGTRFGPRAIREQSLLLWGYHNTLQVSPFSDLNIIDFGDVEIVPVNVEQTHRAVEQTVGIITSAGVTAVSLGGDHSVSLPLLRAHAAKYGPPAVIHFDAHPDTWNAEFGDNPYSHGTPFRRAIEEGLIDTHAYIQIGIRGPTAGPQDYADALALGATMFTLEDISRRGIPKIIEDVRRQIGNRRLYVTFDIDCIDPAFAPGTGTPEVGGLSSREALQLLRGLVGLNFIGFDLVEVSPPFDHSQITAILAANLVFEFLALRLLRNANS